MKRTLDEITSELLALYRQRGLIYKTIDDDELFMHPCFQEAGDVMVYGDETKGRLGDKVYGLRLEHFRQKALEAGVPEDAVKSPAFGNRLFEFTASDETRDRYGDRILVTGRLGKRKFGDGWVLDNYKKNPVFMAFHGYSAIPLGIAVDTWPDVNYQKGKRLRQAVLMDDGVANPAAPLFTAAFTSRLMRAVSVGFWAIKTVRPGDDDERKEWDLGESGLLIATQELWEVSAVSIPANPNALLEEGAIETEQIDGLREFTVKLADAAPELAYSIRSALPTGRTGVIVPKKEPEPPPPAQDDAEPPDDPEPVCVWAGHLIRQQATTVQTLIFPKKHWSSAAECQKWAKDHDFRSDKVDETGESWRLRQKNPGDFIDTSMRTICINPSSKIKPDDDACKVKAVIGKLKKSVWEDVSWEDMPLEVLEGMRDAIDAALEFVRGGAPAPSGSGGDGDSRRLDGFYDDLLTVYRDVKIDSDKQSSK